MGECRAGKRRLAKYKYCSWAKQKSLVVPYNKEIYMAKLFFFSDDYRRHLLFTYERTTWYVNIKYNRIAGHIHYAFDRQREGGSRGHILF
jgi:hypothetical protein